MVTELVPEHTIFHNPMVKADSLDYNKFINIVTTST